MHFVILQTVEMRSTAVQVNIIDDNCTLSEEKTADNNSSFNLQRKKLKTTFQISDR